MSDENNSVEATEKVDSPVVVDAKVSEAKEASDVISAPKKEKAEKKSNSFTKDNGVISSGAADASLEDKKPAPVAEKKNDKDSVALWSDRSIGWSGVGKLSVGYNIVSKEAAEKLLTRRGVRKASPSEVAAHFGK